MRLIGAWTVLSPFDRDSEKVKKDEISFGFNLSVRLNTLKRLATPFLLLPEKY